MTTASPKSFLDRIELYFENKVLVFFFLTVLALVVFWPALSADFVGDDVQRIIEFEPLMSGSLWDVLRYYTTDRPLVMFTIWLNYVFGGLNPVGYKLTNLAFHLICSYCGYLLLVRLFKGVKSRHYIAFFSSVILLIHPLNHHVVQAAVQRSVSMAGIFMIASFISFLNFYEGKTKKDFWYSMFFFLLAVLCKPTAVALPAAIAIYLFYKREKLISIIKWMSCYIPFWFIPIWTYSAVAISAPVAATVKEFKFENWRYFLIQTKVFFIYVFKFIYPYPMEFIHSIHNSVDKIYSENFIPYLVIYVVIFASLSIWFFKKRTLVATLLLMAYVSYLPQSSFYSILHVLFYHRLYLSLLFVAAALILLANKLSTKSVVSFGLVTLFTIYFSASTFIYFSQVKTYPDWLWYNIQANPENLNYNVSALFMLSRRQAPTETVKKFADFITEHNSDPEIKLASSIALYKPDSPNAKALVTEVATYLMNQQTSSSFFHGAMLFLESEAFRFYPKDRAILSLNSIYFSRLNTSIFLGNTILNKFARKNFESVLEIKDDSPGTSLEQLEFFKFRSKIILQLFFKENTGLNLAEAKSLLETKYSKFPEAQWLADRIRLF